MKVILLQDVNGLGIKGDEADVKKGHAYNFLIPKKLVVPFNAQTKVITEQFVKTAKIKEERIKKESAALLRLLQQSTIVLQPKVSEQGRLFKAVSEADVKQAFASKGIFVDTTVTIHFQSPIKERGVYTILIKLPGGIEGDYTLRVE